MPTDTAAQHSLEVQLGKRFEFGANWAKFLSVVNEERIVQAEKSLEQLLPGTIEGKTFLDIGSGSGLFSLAARRRGALVHSFDYDPQSVGCTQEMRRRFSPDESKWMIQQGSVLDPNFLSLRWGNSTLSIPGESCTTQVRCGKHSRTRATWWRTAERWLSRSIMTREKRASAGSV